MSSSSRLIVTTILALVLVLVTGTGVVLAEDHPNGDVINPTQTIDGTWGPGVITATASTPAVPGAWEGITYADGSNGYLNEATVEYGVHAIVLSTTNPIVISNSIIRYNKHAPPAAGGLRRDGWGTANSSCPSRHEAQGSINQGG